MRQPNQLRRRAAFFLLPALFGPCTYAGATGKESRTPTSPPTNTAAPTEQQRARAEDLFISGAKKLDRQDYAAAEKDFLQATQLDPQNNRYISALAITREHHLTALVQQAGKERLLGHQKQATKLLSEARAIDPQNPVIAQHMQAGDLRADAPRVESWLAKGPVYTGPIMLEPSNAARDFDLHSDVQNVLRTVAGSYGIHVAIDDSVQHESLRFHVEQVRYDQAIPTLLQMDHLFAVPIDTKSILVAKDTPENREKFERLLEETIYIPGSTPEEMTDLGNIVRNVFDVHQEAVQSHRGTLVVRAPEPTIKALNLTLNDLIDGGSEVLLEVKLYSLTASRGLTTGLQIPQSVGAYNAESAAQSLVSSNQSIVNQAIAQGLIPANANVIEIAAALIGLGLASSSQFTNSLGFFGGGLTTTGVFVSSGATLNLGLNSSETRALDDIQLRLGDRQEGVFRVGTRYPITVSTYSTGVVANSSSLSGVTINGVSATSLLSQYLGTGSGQTIPQIQYEDLGLTLDATPVVLKSGMVSVKLQLKIEALAGGQLNNIPILSSNQFTSNVTVQNGATAMLISHVTGSQMAAITGTPGLSELPGFQSASATDRETASGQLVLLLTPHIVRRRSSMTAGPRIALNLPPQSE